MLSGSLPTLPHRRPAPLLDSAAAKGKLSPTSSSGSEPVSPTALKRQRALADVEGEESSENQRKKRRLRLELITSRLSRPYAFPSTNIHVSRSVVRVGIWNRQPLPARIPYIKAAILNSVRREGVVPKELVERKLDLYRPVLSHVSYDAMNHDQMPEILRVSDRMSSTPQAEEAEREPPPRPSYTPNYDIFDDEDDGLDDFEEGDGDEMDIHGTLEEDSDPDDGDTLCPFDEVLIAHHYQPPFDKPENIAIAKEIELRLPADRLAHEPFF